MSGIGKFFKKIEDSDAAKIAGAASGIIGYVELLYGFFSEDGTDKILNRIDKLEQTIQQGFATLGDLLNQQIEQVLQVLKTLAMQEAESKARSAAQQLYEYKQSNNNGYLVDAAGRSSEAVEFFKQQTEPFYIFGLMSAGNVRIDVIPI